MDNEKEVKEYCDDPAISHFASVEYLLIQKSKSNHGGPIWGVISLGKSATLVISYIHNYIMNVL